MRSIKVQDKKPKCYLPYEYMNKSNHHRAFYKRMFMEDIANKIIPISLRRNEDKFKVIIDCEEDNLDLVKNILNSFTRTRKEQYNIRRLVKNIIEEIARNIVWYGESIYEICKVSDTDIKMVGLIPRNFIDFKFFYIQLPPKNSEKKLYPKIVSNKLLWKIEIPKVLQKNYSFKTILSRIDQFDSFMPKSMKNDFYQGYNLSTYNQQKYEEKCFLFVNDLTSDWGWDQRQWTSNSKTTEFCNIYKRLKFQYSIAIFREHIISELNNLLTRLEIDAKIKLEGLISSDEYKDCVEKYINAQITYKEVFEFL